MGDTVRYAERVGLVDMELRPDLSPTRFTLANADLEYLALQPERGDFTVTLEPGTYSVEWFRVDGRETVESKDVTVGAGGRSASIRRSTPSLRLYLRSA